MDFFIQGKSGRPVRTDEATLRKVLDAARFNLSRLRTAEGSLPPTETRALELIATLQFEYKELM